MNRLAFTTLALALTAVSGSAFAYQDGYGNGYRDNNNNGRYDSGDSRYDNSGSGPRNDFAQVIRVESVGGRYGHYDNQYGSNLRQECWNEQTNGYENGYYRDSNGRLYRGDGRRSNNNAGGTLLRPHWRRLGQPGRQR